MICDNVLCNKKIDTPLILFNGLSACPHCKKLLNNSADFKITFKNEELFNYSELYYYRYLSPNSYGQNLKKTLAFTGEQLLDLAIKNCEDSAKLGNPKAVFKLGFYYEHYLEATFSDGERIKRAFDFYSKLAYSELTTVPCEKDATPISYDEFELLKRNSMLAILELFNKYPHCFKGSPHYDIEINLKKLSNIYGNVTQNYKAVTKNLDRTKSVNKVMLMCLSKERAPLFGLFKLSGDELIKVFDVSDVKKTSKNFVKYISKNLEIRFLEVNDSKTSHESHYFMGVKDEYGLQQFLDNRVDPNKSYYLYFFNTHGKHAYLSNSQMNRVKNELEFNDFELVNQLVNFGLPEYVFYDDDIHYFKKGVYIKCAERLVEYACGGDS